MLPTKPALAIAGKTVNSKSRCWGVILWKFVKFLSPSVRAPSPEIAQHQIAEDDEAEDSDPDAGPDIQAYQRVAGDPALDMRDEIGDEAPPDERAEDDADDRVQGPIGHAAEI